MLTVHPKANFTLAPFNRESFSTAAPIRNAQAKGKDTTGMVELHLKDEFNTVNFCENKAEAKRVKPLYEKSINRVGFKAVNPTPPMPEKEEKTEPHKIDMGAFSGACGDILKRLGHNPLMNE